MNPVQHPGARAAVRPDAPVILCASPAMRELCATAARVAAGAAKVFISGESGVGKDLIAQYIHAQSPRAGRPFVAVNCAAFTETLLETELFGHARGSFTGAYRDRPGCLEQAHGGTIFLDEVGEMSLRMQADLLRFLESGEIQRVGGGSRGRVDVRVVTATNRDLAEHVAAGQFRKDLLYRIQVIHLRVPPLRERREDIPVLVQHAVERTCRPVSFTPDAMRALERYRWPGNVRELQNVVEQAAWMSATDRVSPLELPEHIRAAPAGGLSPKRERRRQLADDLYGALVGGHYTFWDHIHPLFLRRDMTRRDLRQLVGRGLATTRGNYRSVVTLFGMPASDYKRFMNFIAAHECVVDFHPYRLDLEPQPADAASSRRLPLEAGPPLPARTAGRRRSTSAA